MSALLAWISISGRRVAPLFMGISQQLLVHLLYLRLALIEIGDACMVLTAPAFEFTETY